MSDITSSCLAGADEREMAAPGPSREEQLQQTTETLKKQYPDVSQHQCSTTQRYPDPRPAPPAAAAPGPRPRPGWTKPCSVCHAPQVPGIGAAELKRHLQGPDAARTVLVDTRAPEEIAVSVIASPLTLSADEFEARKAEFKDFSLVVGRMKGLWLV